MNAAPEATDKFWSFSSAFRAAPPSERLIAFEILARRVAGLIGDDFPHNEAVDRLQTEADVTGLTDECGDPAIQELLARGFSNPIVDDEDHDCIDRPP
jgi:hypothetical protein